MKLETKKEAVTVALSKLYPLDEIEGKYNELSAEDPQRGTLFDGIIPIRASFYDVNVDGKDYRIVYRKGKEGYRAWMVKMGFFGDKVEEIKGNVVILS